MSRPPFNSQRTGFRFGASQAFGITFPSCRSRDGTFGTAASSGLGEGSTRTRCPVIAFHRGSRGRMTNHWPAARSQSTKIRMPSRVEGELLRRTPSHPSMHDSMPPIDSASPQLGDLADIAPESSGLDIPWGPAVESRPPSCPLDTCRIRVLRHRLGIRAACGRSRRLPSAAAVAAEQRQDSRLHG